jgi:hypothetical protein
MNHEFRETTSGQYVTPIAVLGQLESAVRQMRRRPNFPNAKCNGRVFCGEGRAVSTTFGLG